MIRIFGAFAFVAVLLAAPRAATAYSLRHLEPGERAQMLTACRRLHHGDDQSLCRRVVDDPRVIVNDKRGCLWAMTMLMQGTAWSKVRSLPAALTCRSGLSRAGYPVRVILRRLNGGT